MVLLPAASTVRHGRSAGTDGYESHRQVPRDRITSERSGPRGRRTPSACDRHAGRHRGRPPVRGSRADERVRSVVVRRRRRHRPRRNWRDGDPVGATLANALAGNILDVDDDNAVAGGHPAVVVLPAIMAAVESEGGTVGDLLDAFLPAYEIAVRTAIALHARTGMYNGSGSWGPSGRQPGSRALASSRPTSPPTRWASPSSTRRLRQ
ncbi:MmgE/PrpD family protein [Haloarculaceae archaeon H-GB2-1]|nr:MmgE/PrpD family protein [Haloarculaceae archaeon H-GB2-1]